MILNGDELKEIISRMPQTIERDKVLELFERRNINYFKQTPREVADMLITTIPDKKAFCEMTEYLATYKKYHFDDYSRV